MAQDTGQRYEFGRLVLDYIRSFMWPVILVLAALFYWEDLMSLIKEREVDVFGVRIGPAVERLQAVEAATQQELQDVAVLVEALKASYQEDLQAAIEQIRAGDGAPENLPAPEHAAAVAQDIDAKLSSLKQNLGREVQQIQQEVTQAPPAPAAPAASDAPATPLQTRATSRADHVARLERRGFEAIVERDLQAAIEAFTEARQLWPDYHNVAEIQRFLTQMARRDAPLDEAAWATINRTILTEYSWGMPADIRAELRATAAAY